VSESASYSLTIPFPSPFPFPFPVSYPFPSFVPFPFPVPISLPCVSSSPSPSSLSLSSPERLRPPLSAPGSAQFSSSSSSSIISSQFSGPTARKSTGLYCRQLGGSIFALRSSLWYQEKRSLVHLIIPKLVVCGLE
jgi:hypothetical protein